jgi:serine/threonine protein kinase
MSQKQMTACPALESFVHWQQGDLPPGQVEHLIEHVETCTHCLKTLEGLAARDPIARHLRQEPPIVNDEDKAELAALERRMRGAGPSAETMAPSGHDTDFHFLGPPQIEDEIGRLGPYRVLRVLGRGGMGIVYQAEDPGLRRMVAIKAMLPTIAASPSAKQRFLVEARAAAAIKHIHIVTIFQIGEERGVPFLAMEFLEGESLEDRLLREATLPLAETLRIGREMAEGLAAAHALGLIHRDIKPGNTWLEGKQGHVKILDFGLARSTTDDAKLTQRGAIIGTPAYMAPEQGNADPLDPRCDLWSLGVVLYRMATGELPFKGGGPLSTLKAVAFNDPLAPARIKAQVPPGLSKLVMKLLKKDPAKRIGSAQEVAEALRELEKDNSPGRRETTSKQTRSRTAVLLALAGALVAAFIASMLMYRPRTEDAEVKGNEDTRDSPEAVLKIAPPDAGLVPKDKSAPLRTQAPPGPRTVSIVHQFQHAGPVTSVALSGDGKHVLTGSLDMTAILWDAATGNKIQTFQGHSQGITSVALSSDCRRVLTGSFDRTAILWDTSNGTNLQIFQGHEFGVTSVALSSDGKHILTGSQDKTAVLWETASARAIQVFQGHTDMILAVALSADGKHVFTGSQDKTAILWELATGKVLRPFPGFAGAVSSVALSGDGKRAVTGAWDLPHGAVLWETDSARQLHVFQAHTTGVTSVALTGDGRFLLTGSADKTAILWDAATGMQLQTCRGHSDRVTSVALDAEGTHIVTGSDDKTAVLWK